MPIKSSGPAPDWDVVDRWDRGATWIAHPEETMRRASHALAAGEETWVVDPLDVPGLHDLLEDFGPVAGVVVLLDRHRRDAERLATRHDVPVWLPHWLSGVASSIDGPVELLTGELADTGFHLSRSVDLPFWREGALFSEDRRTLVVGDALGTAAYFRTDTERIGVHPLLRLAPPTTLDQYHPRRILTGHGPGVHQDAGAVLRHALRGARRRAPALYWSHLRSVLGS